jgi:PKD repeat protein
MLSVGMASAQIKTSDKYLQKEKSGNDIKVESTDSLEIELTIQAGTSCDSSIALGSCILATGYNELIDFPDFINFKTNEVSIGNFGVVFVKYTIAIPSFALEGTYISKVLYNIYRYSDLCTSISIIFKINIIPPKIPIADFIGSPLSIVEGGTVHFTDLSINAISAWEWNFGDGNVSTEKNPTHIYNLSGQYTVSLKSTGPAGSNTKIKLDYISVLPKGTAGVQSWDFQTIWGVSSPPLIDEQGTIYIGSVEHYLYAINPDGTEKWRFLAGGEINYSATGKDGTIYVSATNYLDAIDKEGIRLWSYPVYGDIYDLAVSADEIIYIVTKSDDNTLRAINEDGEMLWSLGLGWISSMPMHVSIAPDGTIYAFGYLANSSIVRLFAISPNGIVKWTRDTTPYGEYTTKVAIDRSGTIYLGGLSMFQAINPDGTDKWTYSNLHDRFYFEPTIGIKGEIYAVLGEDEGFMIRCFDTNGNIKWNFNIPEPLDLILSSVTVGADGILYFTALDSSLYALNSNGTINWKFKFKDCGEIETGNISSPAISDNKTLLIGYGDKFYAISTSSNGLADSPWPKGGQNNKNTGREINPAPYPISPLNNSLHVPLNMTLEWSTIAGATLYEIEIDTTENFSGKFIIRSQLSDTSIFIENLQLSTTYFWRVRANSSEGISHWSPIWSFNTLPNIPSVPILLSPINEANDQEINLLLSWNPVDDAETYYLEVSESSSFNTTIVNQSGLTSNEYSLQGLSINTTYYWRVNASNISGTSNWSEIWNFITTFTTGINKKDLLQVNVYPVPAINILNINGIQKEHSKVSIYTLDGVLVKQLIAKGIKEIDISNLISGTYIVRITNSQICFNTMIVKY